MTDQYPVETPASTIPAPSPSTPQSQSKNKFDLEKAVGAGWKNCWKYFGAYVGILTATSLLCYGPAFTINTIAYFNGSAMAIQLGILVGIITAVLQDLIAFGCLNMQLRVLDGKTIAARDVFSVFPKFAKYLCAGFVYNVICLAGYICLLVPGIIWKIKFQYFGYLLLEKDLSPMQALKASAKLTEGCKMDLFLFGIVQMFIGWGGTLCFLVGQFPAYLINQNAAAHVYRQLLARVPDSELLSGIPMIQTESQSTAMAAIEQTEPSPPHGDETTVPQESSTLDETTRNDNEHTGTAP